MGTLSTRALRPNGRAKPEVARRGLDDRSAALPQENRVTFRRVVLRRFAALGGLILGLVSALGCSSASGSEGVERTDAAGDVVIRFRDEAAKTDAAIVAALTSMDEIPRAIALDARPALEAFGRAVDELDVRAAALSTSGSEMKSKVTVYLDQREKDSATLVDPALRASSMERRREVDASMEKIDRVLKDALPSLADQRVQLRDVLTFLSNDLTPRGLASVKETEGKARENGAKVRKLLVPVIERAELLALDLSPARR